MAIESMIESAHIRIARPTSQLANVVDFYVNVLGFQIVGQFKDHDGFDGVMVGHLKSNYHLEFTCCPAHDAGRAPSQDHLLVIYVPDHMKWQQVTNRIETNGGVPVKSFNPYWDQNGKTYEDPDGYRVVIQNSAWTNFGESFAELK